jgi:hypothetical protein
MAKKDVCSYCCSTGVLNAKLVKTEEGDRKIAVVVCGNHFNNDAAEKTLTDMHLASGLDIDVLRVEKPVDESR